MGRDEANHPHITPQAVERYLRRSGHPDAHLERLRPLGGDTETGVKSYGYGLPLRATFTSGGATRDIVIRTMSPDPFGHDRRADRADAMLLSYDTFGLIPHHIVPM